MGLNKKSYLGNFTSFHSFFYDWVLAGENTGPDNHIEDHELMQVEEATLKLLCLHCSHARIQGVPHRHHPVGVKWWLGKGGLTWLKVDTHMIVSSIGDKRCDPNTETSAHVKEVISFQKK